MSHFTFWISLSLRPKTETKLLNFGLLELSLANHRSSSSTGPSTRSNGMKLKKRGYRSQIRNNFFGMKIVNLWNSLSDTVATAPSVNCFKERFDRQNAGNRFSMEWVNGEGRGETIKSSL